MDKLISMYISRIPIRISKNSRVQGSYEFLAMLEGKIRKAFSFRVQSGKIMVWLVLNVLIFNTNQNSTLMLIRRAAELWDC